MPVVANVLLPILRGVYTQTGLNVVCRGNWAMSEAGFAIPEQNSPFEFKLEKPLDGQTQFPVSGRYRGWFFLRQAAPNKGVKIEDKDMIMKFIKKDSGGYSVDGVGNNKFGSFLGPDSPSITGLYWTDPEASTMSPDDARSDSTPLSACPDTWSASVASSTLVMKTPRDPDLSVITKPSVSCRRKRALDSPSDASIAMPSPVLKRTKSSHRKRVLDSASCISTYICPRTISSDSKRLKPPSRPSSTAGTILAFFSPVSPRVTGIASSPTDADFDATLAHHTALLTPDPLQTAPPDSLKRTRKRSRPPMLLPPSDNLQVNSTGLPHEDQQSYDSARLVRGRLT